MQMFDSLQLKKCMISLINGGLPNEEALTVFNSNNVVDMAVKNNEFTFKVTKLKKVVLQGDTMAPVIASVDMDTVARHWIVDKYIWRE